MDLLAPPSTGGSATGDPFAPPKTGPDANAELSGQERIILRQLYRRARDHADNELGPKISPSLVVECAMTSLVSNREQRRFMAQIRTPATRTRGIPLPEWRKSTGRSVYLAASATGGDMGLGSAAGGSISSSSSNNTSVTDAMRIEIELPENYVADGAVTLKVRAKVGINRQVAQTIGVSGKKILDVAGVGSELIATAAASVTTSYVDYSYIITSTGLVVGDVLAFVVTVINNDTGGAGGAATINIARTWLEYDGI